MHSQIKRLLIFVRKVNKINHISGKSTAATSSCLLYIYKLSVVAGISEFDAGYLQLDRCKFCCLWSRNAHSLFRKSSCSNRRFFLHNLMAMRRGKTWIGCASKLFNYHNVESCTDAIIAHLFDIGLVLSRYSFPTLLHQQLNYHFIKLLSISESIFFPLFHHDFGCLLHIQNSDYQDLSFCLSWINDPRKNRFFPPHEFVCLRFFFRSGRMCRCV